MTKDEATLVQEVLTHSEALLREESLYARYIEAVVGGMAQTKAVKIVRVPPTTGGSPVEFTVVNALVNGRGHSAEDILELRKK